MKIAAVILMITLAVLQYRLWIGRGSLTEIHHLNQQWQAIMDENKLLQERNHSLSAEVTNLKYYLDAIEERARSEMGMIKKDEVFYQLISKDYFVKPNS